MDGFQPLQIARTMQIELAEEDVGERDEQTGDEESGCDNGDQDDSDHDAQGAAHNANGDRSDLLVDRLQILAEAVHHLSQRGDIEELELGTRHGLHQSIVELPRGSEGAEENPQITNESREGPRHADQSEHYEIVGGVDMRDHVGRQHGAVSAEIADRRNEGRVLDVLKLARGIAIRPVSVSRVAVRRSLFGVLIRPLLDPDVGSNTTQLLEPENRAGDHPEPPRSHRTEIQLQDWPLHGTGRLSFFHGILLLGFLLGGLGGRIAGDGIGFVHKGVTTLLAYAGGHAGRYARDMSRSRARLDDVFAELPGLDELFGRTLGSDTAVGHGDNQV